MNQRETPGCGARYTLSPADRRQFDTVDNAANQTEWTGHCQLAPGHSGRHGASVQDCGETEHWIWWDEEYPANYSTQLMQACQAREQTPEGDDKNFCYLYDGHDGEHNFDFTAWSPSLSTVAAPTPDPGHAHENYLQNVRNAQQLADSSRDPAQVWASLAIAAATNRVADLLAQQATDRK